MKIAKEVHRRDAEDAEKKDKERLTALRGWHGERKIGVLNPSWVFLRVLGVSAVNIVIWLFKKGGVP